MATPHKSTDRIWIAGHNRSAKAAAIDAFGPPTAEPAGAIDIVVLAPTHAAEAAYFAQKPSARLTPASRLIVIVGADQPETEHTEGDSNLRSEMDRELAPLGWKLKQQARIGNAHTALEYQRA